MNAFAVRLILVLALFYGMLHLEACCVPLTTAQIQAIILN